MEPIQVKHSELTFQLIVESSPNAIVLVNKEGKIAYVNSQTEKLFGFARSELIGQLVEMLIPQRYSDKHPGFRSTFFSSPTVRSMGAGRELFAIRKDKTEFPIEIGLNPVVTVDGTLVLASIIDITERKKAEERFRLVVESAPNAMVLVNHEGIITLVNRQTEMLFGYERNELVGNKLEILIPKRFSENHPGHRDAFFDNPQTRSMGAGRELFAKKKDGTEIQVEIGLNPIGAAEGQMVLASIIDITERKKGEEQFRLVVESAPNAMVLVNHQGVITLVNRQAEMLFGYERKELIGNKLEVLIPTRFSENHPGHRATFFSNPQTRSMGAGRELFARRKDGSEIQVEIGLNPIGTADGQMVLASIIDITERKKAEEQFRLVVESAPNAMVLVNHKGVITLVNRQTEILFEYERKELIGSKLEILIPERFNHHPHLRNNFFEKPQTRSMGVGRELFARRKNGSEFQVEIGLNPIETAEGHMVLASVIDITERKLQEIAVKRQIELETKNKELEQFAYVASHDLQEPLRTVSNYMQVFEEDYLDKLDDKALRYLRSVEKATKRMSILVKALLDFSRLGRDKKLTYVDCKTLIENVIADLQTVIKTSNAKIDVGEMPKLNVYEIEIGQLFQNLITNAIKFHRNNVSPEVQISSREINGRWEFTVKDNGIGIAPIHFERIFGIFQRLHSSDEYEGNGIGLANCKKIVELHGGEIWIESNLGRGTAFKFTISNIE
jgi:PAS domain S-box-containing protein